MTHSIHDNRLVSYEVQCEQRTITFRTEYRMEHKLTEFTTVVFEGVQAYHFENDAFGNIIFDLAEAPVKWFLKEYAAEISELYRMTGSRRPWAKNLESAQDYLWEQGIKPFLLSSSIGLSGWVTAKELQYFPRPTIHPTA
jgi:hypothetical protein